MTKTLSSTTFHILLFIALITLTNAQSSVTPGHQKMLDLLQQIADETAENHIYLGSNITRQLRSQLASGSIPTRNRWELRMQLARAELKLGNEAAAIEQFTAALRLIEALGSEAPPKVVIQTHFHFGIAYMRLGETQNCCARHTADSCILPLQRGAIHTEQDPSRQAIEHFTEVLKRTAADEPFHLASRWLLNIAYMTIDAYPESVPEAYLIPPKAFTSDEPIQRFTNIAPALGLDTFDLSGGAIADDFDNDGYLDIVVSTWDTAGQLRFFRNTQDGHFSEQTAAAGLTGLYGGLNLVQADYNNDGNVDIFVLRGAWLGKNGRHPNSLLRNNGDGTFTDVTFDAGLGDVHYPTQTASWGDYDNDGDLDLYIGNEATQAFKVPCQLFRNNGDGTFTDVAADARVQNFGYTKSVIWGDYDSDRLPDLYVSNLGSGNRLYRNNGDGTFTNVARKLRVSGLIRSFPSWFWDFDNDGVLDLYVSAYLADIAVLAANLLDMPVDSRVFAHLYRGDGRGGFEEVAKQHNLIRPTSPMGSNFGDLDNDGYLDFYLGTGNPDIKNLMPSQMYLNKEGKRFADVSYAGGFAHIQKGHGVVFADLDNDGDQDIFEQMGGAFPVDRYNNILYANDGFGNHWITIKLVGVQSNRSAIGARIRAEVVENGVRRSIYKHVNSGGSFGANPLRQTIGLGKAAKIETLEVFWPTSGITQTFHNIAANQFIQIVEGENEATILTLKTLKLGGNEEVIAP
jgi:tetratricopeptide (TPR) repeat protein